MGTGAVGCGAYRVHPGSAGYVNGPATPVQVFSSEVYDSLSATDVVIKQTELDLSNNKFSANVAPKVKSALNLTISNYNIARRAWIDFNSAAASNPSVSQAALSGALGAMDQTLKNLAAAKGGK